jgi:translation initiation factor 1 (eIF-1/SUI1)
MPTKKRSRQKRDTILWVRVPKELSMKKLKKLGLEEAHCYGGDTCVTATTLTKDATIFVQGPKSKSLRQLLKNTGLNPRAECFGGDTCIV